MNMSDKRDDGGPAFPILDLSKTQCEGLSCRDWFAGQAMAGILAHPGDETRGSYHNNCDPSGVAAASYKYADAMLKERNA